MYLLPVVGIVRLPLVESSPGYTTHVRSLLPTHVSRETVHQVHSEVTESSLVTRDTCTCITGRIDIIINIEKCQKFF